MSKIFLYGEFQTSLPAFIQDMWEPVNAQLKDVKCLVRKTWLYGIGTNTVGGFYEFDSVENARAFAIGIYVEQAKQTNRSEFTIKLFDGDAAEAASRDMKSSHYS